VLDAAIRTIRQGSHPPGHKPASPNFIVAYFGALQPKSSEEEEIVDEKSGVYHTSALSSKMGA